MQPRPASAHGRPARSPSRTRGVCLRLLALAGLLVALVLMHGVDVRHHPPELLEVASPSEIVEMEALLQDASD
ncbi:hypothetical protein GCM10025788_10810 [Serinicoccus chungangensis]